MGRSWLDKIIKKEDEMLPNICTSFFFEKY